MHWLFLLLGIGSLFIAMRTSSMALMVICLLASLALFVLWIVGWYSRRVGDSSRNDVQMIDAGELRRLREIAESRRNAATPPGEPPPL